MVGALGDTPDSKWLDPCIGRGIFLESLRDLGVGSDRIRGVDIDPGVEPQDSLAKTLRPCEFLRWASLTSERFSRIVGNPPFLALSRLPLAIRVQATSTKIPTGGTVPARANVWFAFLCASIGLLRPQGHICFVLPAAWDYADYATALRATLKCRFDSVEIHRSHRPLFDSVQEGSIVLLARGYRPEGEAGAPSGKESRFEYPDRESLIQSVPIAKRSDVVPMQALRQLRTSALGSRVSLRNVMQIRLGGVTGDAKYFVLSDVDRKRFKLPARACVPIISRARHLRGGRVTTVDWVKLRNEGEKIWLFRPSISYCETPSVRAYLALTQSDGGCDRAALKVKNRSPWYMTPLSERIHGFMSGMSNWGPWVVFSKMDRLNATNTLYTVTFLKGRTFDERAAWAMSLLTSETQNLLRNIGRRYAGGLVKFEPGDIGDLQIRPPVRFNGAYRAYCAAVSELLAGNIDSSRKLADSWW